MKLERRETAEAQQSEAEAVKLNDFYRRAGLNKAVGMSARCPWAFQLSEDELAEAEAAIAAGDPPVPIWTEPNGLRILADPYRKRPKGLGLEPDTTEGRKVKYAGYPGVVS